MKNILSLNGTWHLKEQGDGMETEATVAGELHADLFHAGLIPDPYYGMNAGKIEWVAKKTWEYSRSFDVDEEFLLKQTFLEIDGLNAPAAIILNGEEIGTTEDISITYRFNISSAIHLGENTITIRFDPTAQKSAWIGIQDEVKIVSCDKLSIVNIHVETETEGAWANAWISIEVDNYTSMDQDVMASIVVNLGDNREKIEVADTISPFGGVIEAVIRIEEPQLWWPSGFGESTLYSCMAGLQAEGEVQDVIQTRFGVKNLKFPKLSEQSGIKRTLMINNEEIFCKGADWVFTVNATDKRIRELLKLAKDANINMLRVHDNGSSESSAFYDACDEMGIMVLQDLLPEREIHTDDEESVQKVAREAHEIIARLRNHPCIVMWHGSTEIIPTVLHSLDNSRPYLHDIDFAEFSSPGSPDVESLRAFIPQDKLFPPVNEVWDFYSKGNSQDLSDMTRKMIGDFSSVEEFAALSGILQGELLKVEIERCRCEKWITSGILYRMLNDCRPAIDSSLVDYYLRPKPAYYYARRAFAPVIISFNRFEDRVQLYVVTDDRLNGIEGKLEIGVISFNGGETEAVEVLVQLAPNSSGMFWESKPLEQVFSDPTSQCLAAVLNMNDKIIAQNVFFARPLSEMRFPLPRIIVQREQSEEGVFSITIAADKYARNVAIGNIPASARLSDNYFDLLPGGYHAVIVENATAEQVAALTVNVWRR